MSTYTAPHRAPVKLKHRPRRTATLIAIVSLLFVSLLAASRSPIHAAPASNPIFATIDYVQNAISTALAPIQSAIASLQTQQSNQSTQLSTQQSAITDIQSQLASQTALISSLQNSTSKSLHVLDANDNDLGTLVNHNSDNDVIYSSTLGKFIHLADNSAAITSYDSNGIGPVLSTIFYQSSNCTGTAYSTTFATNANNIVSINNQYYSFHSLDTSSSIPQNSELELLTSNHYGCFHNFFGNVTAWQLYPITLPFSTPIAEPIQFKYQ